MSRLEAAHNSEPFSNRSSARVACLCVTYRRPAFLYHAIESFLRQDYPNRQLIILDDAGQYRDSLAGDRWRLFSTSSRFATLGDKRNAAAALAGDDTDIFAVWDDDDIYLPWHLSAAVQALADGDVAMPSTCWFYAKDQISKRPTRGLFHSGWCFTKDAFHRAGGYPPRKNDEDKHFARRLREIGATFVDPCKFAPPSLIYRWDIPVTHISTVSLAGYDRLGDEPVPFVESLTPNWDRDWVAAVRAIDPTAVPDSYSCE